MKKELSALKENISQVWWQFNASHPHSDCYYLGHHKCASNWMRKFLYDVCQIIHYNYKIYGGNQSTDISSPWRKHTFHLYVNSISNTLESVPQQARGFHLIRDPRDVLISTYFSHRNSHRLTPQVAKSRGYLKEHSLQEGLLYMVDHCPYFKQIEGWKIGSRSNILEVKYEELLTDEKGVFEKILRHLMITVPDKKLSDIVQRCSFNSLSGGRDRGEENSQNHFRKGIAGDWKNYMEENGPVYKAFFERYGHLVSLLGYK